MMLQSTLVIDDGSKSRSGDWNVEMRHLSSIILRKMMPQKYTLFGSKERILRV